MILLLLFFLVVGYYVSPQVGAGLAIASATGRCLRWYHFSKFLSKVEELTKKGKIENLVHRTRAHLGFNLDGLARHHDDLFHELALLKHVEDKGVTSHRLLEALRSRNRSVEDLEDLGAGLPIDINNKHDRRQITSFLVHLPDTREQYLRKLFEE